MQNYQKPNKKRIKAVVNLRDVNKLPFSKIGNKLNITGEGARRLYIQYYDKLKELNK